MTAPQPYRPPVLVSYAYLRRSARFTRYVRELAELGHPVMVDSGAYTVYRSGAALSLNEYAGFLRANAEWLHRYVTLDVIGEPVATEANLARMREAGLDPMPVLVLNGTIDDAERLVDGCRTPQLCVAGGTGKLGESEAWFRNRLVVLRKRLGPACWVHALGYTAGMREVTTMAADASDSASPATILKFGGVMVVDRRATDFRFLARVARPPSGSRQLAHDRVRLLAENGLGADDIDSSDLGRTNSRAMQATFRSYRWMQRRAEAAGKMVYAAFASLTLLKVYIDAGDVEEAA